MEKESRVISKLKSAKGTKHPKKSLHNKKPASQKRLVPLDFDKWRRDVRIGLVQVHEFSGDDSARAECLIHAHMRQVFHIVVFT